MAMQNEIREHLETIRQLQISHQKKMYQSSASGHHVPTSYKTGGAPSLPMTDFKGRETYVDNAKTKVRGRGEREGRKEGER